MARQTGELKITGTIDGVCFYKMGDVFYARMKSSLSGKRFRKDKVFEGSRKSAERFALGNRVASEVYRMVEKEKRVYQLFCFLKKKAIALGKERKDEKDIKRILIELLEDPGLFGKEKKNEKAMHEIVSTKVFETAELQIAKIICKICNL